jgi:hypothetical protein
MRGTPKEYYRSLREDSDQTLLRVGKSRSKLASVHEQVVTRREMNEENTPQYPEAEILWQRGPNNRLLSLEAEEH